MADKLDPQATVTGGSLAALLNITARHVADLGDRGVMKRDAAGGYQLHNSVHGYVKFLKESAKDRTKTAFSRRLQDARARSVELKNAQEERRLIETSEALAVVDEVTGQLRADLDALPARVGGRDMVLRRKVVDERPGKPVFFQDILMYESPPTVQRPCAPRLRANLPAAIEQEILGSAVFHLRAQVPILLCLHDPTRCPVHFSCC
jgi:phage terminase Nu1 subunit (DNA packaging protein)